MALYRTAREQEFKNYGIFRDEHITIPQEWGERGADRHKDPVWESRYRFEAGLILSVCDQNGYKKILELGSGPGRLGQIVLGGNNNLSYSYVDKIGAKVAFEKESGKGDRFHVKDMMDQFDTADLDTDYDLIIANDFLEHLANPSDIMYKARNITKSNAGFFVSVPNWRMGHWFIYRGLFDFDNWIYFCGVHGWNVEGVSGSDLKCQKSPKLQSEELLPDDLIDSWNWYFSCKKE